MAEFRRNRDGISIAKRGRMRNFAILASALLLSACTFKNDNDRCGTPPETTGAIISASVAQDSSKPVMHIGDQQTVGIQLFLQRSPGWVMSGGIGTSEGCQYVDGSPELVDDFEVSDAHCDDDACTVVRINPLIQAHIDVDVVVNKPNATLHVKATDGSDSAEKTIALSAAP